MIKTDHLRIRRASSLRRNSVSLSAQCTSSINNNNGLCELKAEQKLAKPSKTRCRSVRGLELKLGDLSSKYELSDGRMGSKPLRISSGISITA